MTVYSLVAGWTCKHFELETSGEVGSLDTNFKPRTYMVAKTDLFSVLRKLKMKYCNMLLHCN